MADDLAVRIMHRFKLPAWYQKMMKAEMTNADHIRLLRRVFATGGRFADTNLVKELTAIDGVWRVVRAFMPRERVEEKDVEGEGTDNKKGKEVAHSGQQLGLWYGMI